MNTARALSQEVTPEDISQEPEFSVFVGPEAEAAGLDFRAPREGDAGFDLPALEDVAIAPGKCVAIRTGIHISIPIGYVGLVRDRSSVALKAGACTAGVIDSSYRGEVKVVMHNLGENLLEFKSGDRVAQLLVIPHLTGGNLRKVDSLVDLGSTQRNVAGFGSTGR